MMGRTWLMIAVLVGGMALDCPCVEITWSNFHSAREGGAMPAWDWGFGPLRGTSAFGPVDLAKGSLVQLIKAVGEIDEPWMSMPFYEDPDCTVDDVILDEVHCGYGTFVQPDGTWSRTVDVAASAGDFLYVRAFNAPKPDWAGIPLAGRDLTIRNICGRIVCHRLKRDDVPLTLYFDGLVMGRMEWAQVSIEKVGEAVSLRWNFYGPGQYVVQYTDDLLSGVWRDAPGTWPNSQTSWQDEDASGVGRRFYRIVYVGGP